MTATINRWPRVAVLLAAGRGQRLRPLTDHTPKCLLPANGRPVIDYALDAIARVPIPRVDIVVHYFADKVRQHVGHRIADSFLTTFSDQALLNGTANALAATARNIRELLSASRYLVVAATDYAYPGDYVRELCAFHESHDSEISVSLRPISSSHATSSSVAIVSADGYLTRIIEKPAARPVGPTLAASLLYVVPASIFHYAESTPCSSRGERELPDTINMMIDAGIPARGFPQAPLQTLDLYNST